MRPICFLSDFGLADDFVGSCKGLMSRIAPGVQVVDLTHEIPGFSIELGAETLRHATRYMPDDAVYLAVVDPGVGTSRRSLALQTESGAFMVGPDNGLLVPAAESLGDVLEAVELTNGRYHVHPVSSTFHGRDIFAPAAAHLAAGGEISVLGESVEPASLVRLHLPGPERNNFGEGIVVRVMEVDRYGNARLSLMHDELGVEYGTILNVDTGDGNMRVHLVEAFGATKAGELILVPDSHWRLSLSINQGNVAQALSLKVDTPVRLSPLERSCDART